MSYDKRMKDLMARLVAMSPEPPPYPDDMPMASQPKPRSSRPALVFAAAAVLVLLLAVPLLLFTGGPDPIVGGSTTTTSVPGSTSTPNVDTTPPTNEATTTTTRGVETTTTEPSEGTQWAGLIYLYQSPENSFVGNPALVPLSVEITADPGTFSDHTQFDSILALLADSGTELPEPFANVIPSDVRVVWWGEENGLVRLDMNEAFLAGAGGVLADMTMLNQLIYNVTWMNEDASVLFTVNDEAVEAYGSEGLDLTAPVNRESYLDHLHVINLTSPVIRQGDGPYLVEGIANVFEATLNVEVLDGDGNVVYEEFVNASAGTGTFGEFSTTIPAELINPGESSIRVFTRSAEDGSDIEVITVPIPEGNVWEYTVGG